MLDFENRVRDNPSMDWKTLITDLQGTGLSQSGIGVAVGRSQAWVADILRGRYEDLKWSDGEALRALHAKRCGVADKAAA